MKIRYGCLGIVLFVGLQGAVWASGTDADEMKEHNPGAAQPMVSLYDQGVAADKNGEYQQAIGLFQQVVEKEPDNADALNMLAHSQRKSGSLEAAILNYKKALKIRPDFPEAHEYLGEAYLQATLRELEMLKKAGASASDDREDLTKDIKEAASQL